MLLAALGACGRSGPVAGSGARAGTDAAPVTVTVAARDADAGTRPDAAAAPDAAAMLDGLVDAPMKWSEERAGLMLAYRRLHQDPDAVDLAIEPQAIVLHYTGGGSARATMRYFDNPRIEAERAALRQGGAANVSAHFVVDRDGTIYQLQPETRMARHCIGLNHVAIGVENVGDEDRWPLTDAQVEADARLVRWLVARHPITHLVGHHEVMSMRRHPLFVERVAGYRNSKPDPGAAFMGRVRARVADLGLRGPTE